MMRKTNSKKTEEEWVYSVDYGREGVLLDNEFFFVMETSNGRSINYSPLTEYDKVSQDNILDALESYSFEILDFKDEDSNDEEV